MYLAEVSDAALVLPSTPLGLPAAPLPVPPDFRGVAIHWVEYALPTTDPARRFAPSVPILTWNWAGVSFSSLSPDRTDQPPQTAVEQDAYVRLAAAMAAARHALSPQSTLLWEVRIPSVGSAAFRVRLLPRVVTRTQSSGTAAFTSYAWGTWDTPPPYTLGTAACRVHLRPLAITGVGLRRGIASLRVDMRAEGSVELPNLVSSVSLRAYSWGTWGTVPFPSPVEAGAAACRVHLRPLAITGVGLKRGVVSCRVDMHSEGVVGPHHGSGTASYRARVW